MSAVTEMSIKKMKTNTRVAQLEKKSLLFKVKKTSPTVAQKDKRLIGTVLPPNAVRPQRIKSSLTTKTVSVKPDMPAAKLKKIMKQRALGHMV